MAFEHQSMMWGSGYGRLTLEEARRIAEKRIVTYFPGGEIEEYVFPGYYTFHFTTAICKC